MVADNGRDAVVIDAFRTQSVNLVADHSDKCREGKEFGGKTCSIAQSTLGFEGLVKGESGLTFW